MLISCWWFSQFTIILTTLFNYLESPMVVFIPEMTTYICNIYYLWHLPIFLIRHSTEHNLQHSSNNRQKFETIWWKYLFVLGEGGRCIIAYDECVTPDIPVNFLTSPQFSLMFSAGFHKGLTTITQLVKVRRALCHKSSFNPCCNVHGFFFLKTSYVSLIYKCRIVLKIFTDPFLSYTPPQRGEISNFINRQTKSAWKIYNKLINPPQSALYTPRDQYS